MKLKITFKRSNPEFDQKYANEYHFGKESDTNWKDIWSTSFRYDEEFDEYSLEVNSGLPIPPTNEKELSNMTILSCKKDNKIIARFAVSSNLVEKTYKIYNQKSEILRFYFYFNEREDYSIINDGVYILNSQFNEIQ